LYNISYDLPIGAKVHLKDEAAEVVHEVQGYEWYQETGNVIFKDGAKLNMDRLEMVSRISENSY